MSTRKPNPRKIHFTVTVTEEDRDLLVKAAEHFLLSASSWARLILLEAAAKRVKPKAR